MAMHTPIFSAARICSPHKIFQGSSARHMSIIADHTASHVSQKGYKMALFGTLCLPAWNCPYTIEGCLLMQWPGMKSTKVLASGLHCTHGMIVVGIAKIAKVEIAKYTTSLIHPSVNRSKVIPNEILLRAIAIVYIVSSAAP